eukprot:SAG11_NODE_12062_length_723_cov_1.743590_1_plen_66_part_01
MRSYGAFGPLWLRPNPPSPWRVFASFSPPLPPLLLLLLPLLLLLEPSYGYVTLGRRYNYTTVSRPS